MIRLLTKVAALISLTSPSSFVKSLEMTDIDLEERIYIPDNRPQVMLCAFDYRCMFTSFLGMCAALYGAHEIGLYMRRR